MFEVAFFFTRLKCGLSFFILFKNSHLDLISIRKLLRHRSVAAVIDVVRTHSLRKPFDSADWN